MEADAYADSSFLVSLYRTDGRHVEAHSFLAKNPLTIAYTPLHRIEVRNALRNSVAAGHLSKAEYTTAFRQIEEDLRDGFLINTSVPWTDAFRRADQLSEKHSSSEGLRTIDLLHVAIALDAGARLFISFDIRQRKLAKAAGLTVKPAGH